MKGSVQVSKEGRGEEGRKRRTLGLTRGRRAEGGWPARGGGTSSYSADPPLALSSASKKPVERGSLGDTGRALSLLERGRIKGAGQQML